MAGLTPEERRRIYEEEKYRIEVQGKLKPKKTFSPTGIGCLSLLILLALGYIISSFTKSSSLPATRSTSQPTSKSPATDSEDKSAEIAKFIQRQVNTGGYAGCVARRVGYQAVEVRMNFPAGTTRATVEANTSGVADHFAQVGRLASTIYYRGYSGEQRVCEYKYDPYSASVKKTK
jgi:hypothetical protein